ncbi:Pentatricopeptide repeat-containing protein [Arachis hypogaea]|nr:Pentatricopeptide repeat-containing protein [Arachis hypogaea]
MEALGVIPNDITCIAVLHACSHTRLVQEGKRLFCRMVNEFSLVPKIEHDGCMVDLLGRAGSLEEAQELIKDMPMRPNSAILGSFLAACKVHKNVNLAEWAAKQFLSLEFEKYGYNLLMSNIYAASNRWKNVADIRRAMKDAGIHKEPDFSSIEVHGTIHEFVTGDREHPETPKIYEMIAEMREKLEHAGYTPNISVVLEFSFGF